MLENDIETVILHERRRRRLRRLLCGVFIIVAEAVSSKKGEKPRNTQCEGFFLTGR